MPVGYPAEITATVTDNVAKIEDEAEAKIVIRDIEIPTAVYRNHEFPMPFTVENKGDLEFYSTVTPYILDTDGNEVAKSKFRPLDVFANASERIKDYVAKFTVIEGKEFPAGDYKLVFRDEAGKEVSERIDITIGVNDDKTEIEITGLTLDEKDPITDPTAVKFTFRVECKSGVYFGSPRVAIFPGDGGYELYNKSSESIYLTVGEQKYVSVITDLSELQDGHYQAAVYSGGVIMAEGLHFTLDRLQTGLTDPISDNLNGTGTVYRLNGVVQKGSLTPGLYIIDGKVVLTQ